MELLIKYANQHGSKGRQAAVLEVVRTEGKTPLPETVEGLNFNSDGTVYAPALAFVHACYLNSVLEYPVARALSIANSMVTKKGGDRLSSLYKAGSGSVGDQRYAVNKAVIKPKLSTDEKLSSLRSKRAALDLQIANLEASAYVTVSA